jgi:hypothetical protein
VPEPADLTFVGSSSWVVPGGPQDASPSYPSGILEGDVVYAVVAIKPDTATVDTPVDWSSVGSATGGGGSQGGGTGPIGIHVFKRTVPAGGLSGSQTFSTTGASSRAGCMQAWRATGAGITWDTETLTSYSRPTASSSFGGTGSANIGLDAKDAVVIVIGSADDQSNDINVTSLTIPGGTHGGTVQAPSGTGANNQGNDIAAASEYAIVASGPSTGAPSVTATGNSSETGMGLFFRVSAQREPAIVHEGQASLTATAAVTVAGAIITIHEDQAAVAATASIAADAVVTAPPEPSPISAEPGYAEPGAMQVGTVWTTTEMGGSPTAEGDAALDVEVDATAVGAVTRLAQAGLDLTAGMASSGQMWGAVQGLSATPISMDRIDLEWDPMEGATGYDIERDSVVIAEDVPGVSYIDEDGLIASTEYDYRVAAVR